MKGNLKPEVVLFRGHFTIKYFFYSGFVVGSYKSWNSRVAIQSYTCWFVLRVNPSSGLMFVPYILGFVFFDRYLDLIRILSYFLLVCR